ncbi:hypothetical protein ACEWY4_000145 [Coilia grayii]|uniref:TNFR-Cys domain-containing protein n=1 Tax=Coilia grayii TaxID=363190 RepID=A0ABD1KVU7_9TELE
MASQTILELPLALILPTLLILLKMFLAMLIMLVLSLPAPCGICLSQCSPAEYEVMGGCCPMCSPGYHVHRHCTEFTSTTCAPCPASTYTDTYNGLESCRRCTVCDPNVGLRIKRNCSSSSDTLCELLEGHYCTDPIKDGCRGAVEHTKCLPGQYIKQKGTSSSDTVCSDCDSKTYSDGSFASCRPHTQCKLGYDVTKEGTSSSDTECQMISVAVATAVVIAVVIAVCVLAILVVTAVAVTVKRIPLAETYGTIMKRNEKDPKCEQGEEIPLDQDEKT